MIADFAAFPRFKTIGLDRFVASCPGPLHANGDKTPSLSGKVCEAKLLLKCFAGCATADILSAAGLTWQALFADHVPGSASEPASMALRRRRAGEELEQWRELELRRTGEKIRSRDMSRIGIIRELEAEHLTEQAALEALAPIYAGYAELENRFDLLLRNDRVLEFWRESRGAA